jgi:hypothetical protein
MSIILIHNTAYAQQVEQSVVARGAAMGRYLTHIKVGLYVYMGLYGFICVYGFMWFYIWVYVGFYGFMCMGLLGILVTIWVIVGMCIH